MSLPFSTDNMQLQLLKSDGRQAVLLEILTGGINMPYKKRAIPKRISNRAPIHGLRNVFPIKRQNGRSMVLVPRASTPQETLNFSTSIFDSIDHMDERTPPVIRFLKGFPITSIIFSWGLVAI
jgi:hypothetical protein